MNPFYKNLALWMVIGLIVILLFNLFQANQSPRGEIIFSDFLKRVETGEVREVTLRGQSISGRLADPIIDARAELADGRIATIRFAELAARARFGGRVLTASADARQSAGGSLRARLRADTATPKGQVDLALTASRFDLAPIGALLRAKLFAQQSQFGMALAHQRAGCLLDGLIGFGDGAQVGFFLDAQTLTAKVPQRDLIGAIGDAFERREPGRWSHGFNLLATAPPVGARTLGRMPHA